jgi:hypothetical protein
MIGNNIGITKIIDFIDYVVRQVDVVLKKN